MQPVEVAKSPPNAATDGVEKEDHPPTELCERFDGYGLFQRNLLPILRVVEYGLCT